MALDGETHRLIIELERFCAYQERSPFEINVKLRRKGATEIQVETIIQHLVAKNFLNESRFVEAYVQGKSSIKRWGAQRIKSGLIAHHISESLIDQALSTLSKSDHAAHLLIWLQKKQNSLKDEAEGPKKKAKIVRFLLSKGFSLEEILKAI
jgi:regulatory protein